MKQPYRWRCFACDESNERSASSCSSCGFPARASGAEIATARAVRRGEMSPARGLASPPPASMGELLAGWSGWQKGMAITGAGLVAMGGYAGNGMASWRGLGLSVLALMFGVFLLLVAFLGRNGSKESRGGADH